MAEKSVFQTLYDINVNDKVKQKNGLNYISWADSLAEIKKVYPDATYKVYEQIIDAEDIMTKATRPWFDDGKSGWVKVSVTIDGKEAIEYYPIMDFKNKAIPAENITSTDANKAIQRGLTKAAARHGLGLYIYSGEDIPKKKRKRLRKKPKKRKLNWKNGIQSAMSWRNRHQRSTIPPPVRCVRSMSPTEIRRGSLILKVQKTCLKNYKRSLTKEKVNEQGNSYW